MRRLWLLWLPMVFLPSFGYGAATVHGVVELSDYLIGPLVALTWLAGRRRGRLQVDDLTPWLLCFVTWSLLSTLLVRERYGYPTYYEVIFGSLKLGKFVLYGTAGLLASRAVADEADRRIFMWSLLASGLVVAVSLFQFSGRHYWVQEGQTVEGYKANNGISVMMAMLLCYFGGLWLSGWGTYRWRVVAIPGMVAMTLGFFLSEGRGGWVAGVIGAGYLMYRRGLNSRVVFGLGAAALVTVIAYLAVPTFTTAIDLTIEPDAHYLENSVQYIPGVDDGERFATWATEAPKLLASPFLGTGFFHRSGASGLFFTGSHNFFLQMVLETGIIGGLLLTVIVYKMWKHTGSAPARAAGQEIPLRAALIAGIIGGMTGEYFYGSTPLTGLFLIYAGVGGLPIQNDNEIDPSNIAPGIFLGTPDPFRSDHH